MNSFAPPEAAGSWIWGRRFTSLTRWLGQVPTSFVLAFHLALTLVLFLPALTGRYVLTASTDNEYHTLPGLLFSLRSLQAGDAALWNPYLLCGTDFTASSFNFTFSPLTWIMLLFPETEWFRVLTVRFLLEVWLTGVFGYLAFHSILGSRGWGLFCSMLLHLCSIQLLGLTIFPVSNTVCLGALSLYWLSSLDRRPKRLSFAALTLTFSLMIVSGHLVYVVQMILGVLVLHALVVWTTEADRKKRWRSLFVAASSAATAVLIGALRLLPFLGAVEQGNRIAASFREYSPAGRVSWVYFSLVPETLGINLRSSRAVFESLGAPGSHVHETWGLYFGTVPLLLMASSFFLLRGTSTIRWLAACMGLFWIYQANLQPVAGAMAILAYPHFHPLSSLMLNGMGLCLLAGYVGREIERDPTLLPGRRAAWLFGFFGLALLGAQIPWLRMRAQIPALVWVLPLAGFMAALGVAGALREGWIPAVGLERKRALLRGLIPFLGIVAAAFLVFASWIESEVSLPAGVMGLLVGLLALALLRAVGGFGEVRVGQAVALAGGGFFVILLLLARPEEWAATTAYSGELAQWGSLRFLIAVVFLAVLLALVRADLLRASHLAAFLTVAAAADLLAFNREYLHVIKDPFVEGRTPYPKTETVLGGRNLDLERFRVNQPHLVLDLYGSELLTNIPALYGVRMYGGLDSQFSRAYQEFLQGFAPKGIPGTESPGQLSNRMTHPRFLDVAGVGYDYDSDGGVRRRPEALPRFALYSDFRVTPSASAVLDRLKDDRFDPGRTILLESDPGLVRSREPVPSEPVRILKQTPSRIEVRAKAAAPSVLFFGDSYSTGWTATVNGRERPILRAHGNFMAVGLDGGESEVILRFMPSRFRYGLGGTLIGAAIVLGSLVTLRVGRRTR